MKRIAFVYPAPNFDSVPSLMNAARFLVESGFAVDVFTDLDHRFTRPHIPGVRFYFRGNDRDDVPSVVRTTSRGLLRSAPGIAGGLRKLWDVPVALRRVLLTQRHAIALREAHNRHPYLATIAVDLPGVIATRLLRPGVGGSRIYYSLEVKLRREATGTLQMWQAETDHEGIRAADLIIIQDDERGELLAHECGVAETPFIYIPNAPMGGARPKRGRYWHQRFPIGDRRVALHAGSFRPWAGLPSFLAHISSWPEDWVLVVHSAESMAGSSQVTAVRESAPSDRVFFSDAPVPSNEVPSLFNSADAGLAFYVPVGGNLYTQENNRVLGLSSGKIAAFAQAGVPVIVNRHPTVAKRIAAAGAGLVVDSAADVPNALREISRDWSAIHERATLWFESEWRVEPGLSALAEHLASLGNET